MAIICSSYYFETLKRLVAAVTILAMILPTSGLGVVYAQDQGLLASGNYAWQMVESGQLTGATDPQQFEGYEFVPAKDGFVTELCGFFQGTHAVDLYDSSFDIVASITISSYEQWNCAAINPVAVKKQGQYYVIAEIFSGSAFKQPASLPQTSGNVSIVSGVTQPVTAGFGQKLKSDSGFVFGLVDVKFSSDSKDVSVLQQAGASLASSAAPAAGPAGQAAALTGQAQSNGNQNTLKNCASGKCIVCSMSGCQINDDSVSQPQTAPTFIQTCAGGFCYSCTNGNCAKTDAAGIVKTGYSYKNCSANKCLTCVNGDCVTTGGSIPKYTYQDDDSTKKCAADDCMCLGSCTFADWAGYFSMSTDVTGGDAMDYAGFMAIVASLNQNTNNASLWEGTSNGLNYKLIIPSLPGQVAVTANAVATATIYNAYGQKAAGLSLGANLISAYKPELAKSMSTAAIGFGVAQTNVAQQYYNALEANSPTPKDNSVTTGTKTQAGQSLDLSKNALAVTSLLGAGINANGQVITNATTGAPVQMAAVAGSINTALQDVNYKTSDLYGWGTKDPVPGNLDALPQDRSKIEQVTNLNVSNPIQITAKDSSGNPVQPGGKVTVPEIDTNGNVVGMTNVIVGADGKATIPVVGNATNYVNANLKYTAPTLSASAQTSAASVLQQNGYSVASPQGDTPATSVTQPQTPKTSATQKTTQGTATTGQATGLAGTPVALYGGSDLSIADMQDYIKKAIALNGMYANGQITTSVDKTGSANNNPGNQATGTLSNGTAATASGASYTVTNADGTTYDYVGQNGPTAAQEQQMMGVTGTDEPWVSSNPNLAACDSVFYGTNQAKEFSDSDNGGSSNGSGTPATTTTGTTPTITTTTTTTTATTTIATTTGTQTSGSVTAINGKILSVKDLSNTTRTVDITNAVVKLNGNTVSSALFKFVPSDQVKVAGIVSANSIAPTEVDITRVEVKVACPIADICIPGNNAVQMTTDYANIGVVCPPGWTCIPESSAGPIGVPLTQGSFELRFASLSLKNLATGASASLISALDKGEAQNPENANPPQIVDYQPRLSDGKDITITLQTDEPSTCKYSPYDLPWNFMWNALDTQDGLTHTSHVGTQTDGTYMYYAQCQDKQGLSSKDYMFMYSVGKNYDSRVETDKTPPAVANVSVSSPSLAQGTTENITVQIGDNVGVADAVAQIKDTKGQYLAVLGLDDSGQSGAYMYQWDTTSRPAGQYQVTVVADDSSGNFSRADNVASFAVANSQTSGITTGNQGSGANICKPLVNNGSASDKLDVVFVPCGFGSDMSSFEMLAQAASDKMLSVTPFSDNKQKFNVTLAEVPGLTCGDTLASDMDNDGVRFREVALACNPDAVIILKKGGEDGGISLPGSRIAFMLASDPFLAAHELGHAFFRLNDEYSYGCTAADLSTSFNCDDSPKCGKWKGLKGAKCIAGCTCEGNYRSSDNSVMFDSRTATSFSPAATQHILDVLSAFK